MKKISLGLFVLLIFVGISTRIQAQDDSSAALTKAVFAGGCFWCLESDMEKLDGVVSAVSGYMGGTGENPTYGDYSKRGFVEVVEVTFDPARLSYEKLLEYFWRHVDPVDAGGQFCDRGHAYTTGIFYADDAQREAAERSKSELDKAEKLGKPVVTPIVAATVFYPAEDYHQDYYKKNSLKYKYYRFRCGRDQRIKEIWK